VDNPRVPELVKRANELALQVDKDAICSIPRGRLLQFLASQYQNSVLAEIGSFYGCTTAWMISSMPPGSTLVATDTDPVRVSMLRALFQRYPNVSVIHGGLDVISQRRYFGLIYIDIHNLKIDQCEDLLGLLRTGGVVVVGNIRDVKRSESKQQKLIREFWLMDNRLLSTELFVLPGEAVILATRIA
jgi:predicted O-methyltransferase YrrM